MKRYRVGDRVYLEDGKHRFWMDAGRWRWARIEWPDDGQSYYGTEESLEMARKAAR